MSLHALLAAVRGDEADSGSRSRHGPRPVQDGRTAANEDESEAVFLERLRSGDPTAFDTLVDTYFDRVTRFAYGILGQRDASEDITQEVFVSLWERRERWQPQGTIIAYLFRAVRNKALNLRAHERMRAAAAEWIGDEVSPPHAADDAVLHREQVSALLHAIAELPEHRQTAIRLRYQESLTYPMIAEVMGMSVKSAEQLVSLTIKSLRQHLKRSFP